MVAPAALAQVTIPQEYGKTIKTAEVVGSLGTDLFGDQTNFYTGSTTFSVTDVSLKGNSALPVAIGRSLEVGSHDETVQLGDGMFGDWDLEIPHLSGTFAQHTGWQIDNYSPATGWGDPNQRCSGNGLRQAITTEDNTASAGVWYGPEYWQGFNLHVPGAGSQELLVLRTTSNPNIPTDGKSYQWVTGQQWFASCLPTTANGYPGEGFLVLAPDGTRYTFDWFVQRDAPIIIKERGSVSPYAAPSSATSDGQVTIFAAAGDRTALSRVEVWILPTKIQDRFGNTVSYTYDSANPWRLKTILANDGRRIDVSYTTGGRISSVSAGGRTWTYTYGSNGLQEVRLPDLSKWVLGIGHLRNAKIEPETSTEVTAYCDRVGSKAVQPTYTATMTHPSGAVGTFTLQPKVHGRSYVQKVCIKPDPNGLATYAKYPYLFDAIGLTRKQISGPGLETLVWDYQYGPATNESWLEDCTNNSCIATKTVSVDTPDGFVRYTFSNRWKHSEGRLLKVEQAETSTSAPLRTEVTTYLWDPSGQNYPPTIGQNPFDRGDQTTESPTPMIRREVTQQGRVFTWAVPRTNAVYSFDVFGRPTKVVRSSGDL
jgi:hypothetical protein